MVKLMHILTDTGLGGAGVWLLNFLSAYDREKYDVSVALPENSVLTERVRNLSVTVFEVPFIADSSYSEKGTKEFLRLFRREKPDLVHCHASLSARIAAKRCGIPVVNTRHCLEEPLDFPKRELYGLLNNALSDIVIGVSEKTCENLAECGTKKSKIRLVYNGVRPVRRITDDEKASLRARYGVPPENTVVGLVARLEPVKNPFLFLEGAKIILAYKQDVTFLIVGGGSLEGELHRSAKEMGISENIVFAGQLDDISGALGIMDIITLTSEKEALSISLIEGMSIGLPAVSTDSGGPNEVIEDGVTGKITENGNAEAFADAVLYYLSSPTARFRDGKAGKKRAREKFGLDTMVSELDKIYAEILKKGK
ncbi:MAG: glycosyltransferase [Eubacteriales bacterium]